MLKRRIFWLSKVTNGAPVDVAHPYDCQYVNFTREKILELAKQLAGQGLIKLEGDRAIASDWLMQQEPAMIAAMQKGVDAGKAATKITA